MSERVWSVHDALEWTVSYLEGRGIEHPRLSSEWLLSAATGLSRVELYAYHDRPLTPEERATLRDLVKRRAEGVPLQYVTGEMPFRHVVMQVRPGAFIPRPETEVLVDVVLRAVSGAGSPTVVDLCTGSGCVACSLAHELPSARVYATELSSAAVDIAKENADRLDLSDRVTVLEGDLFAPLPRELRGRVDAVSANPPYIPSADVPELAEEVIGYEPHLALDGGPDGLDVARRIMREAPEWLVPGGVLSMELDERRVVDAAKEMEAWYEGVETVPDLTGRPRIITGRRP